MQPSSHTVWSRIGGSALFFLALFLGTTSFRLILEGKEFNEAGVEQRGRGDHLSAISAFENAAKAYVPGSPYQQRGLRELELMARGALMRGNAKEAGYIYEVIRRSVLSTRHFWQPSGDVLRRAENSLAKLHSGSVEELSLPGGALERPRDPGPILVVFLIGGFLLWIGGAVAILLAKPSDSGLVRNKWAWSTTLLGLATWLLMSWMAT